MPSFKRLSSGKWQAQVARQGVRRSKSFQTKQEAKDWAARTEYEILNGNGHALRGCLRDIFLRYSRDVSPQKRGGRWERIRLARFSREPIADTPLSKLTPAVFAEWRDQRLKEVSGSTVNREMQLVSHALSIAQREWGWLNYNPITGVRRPPCSPPRERRITEDEIERILNVAGYEPNNLSTNIQRVAHAFLFAIETAMRAGEIVGLTWPNVDLNRQVAHLPMTKNGRARDVPLSKQAVRLLKALPRIEGDDRCFRLKSDPLATLSRRIIRKANIVDLRFHDTRHEAVTRLASKMDLLSLARTVGHRDIRMLQVYYNETADQLAKKLDD